MDKAEAIESIVQQCIEAIEKDFGKPIELEKLIINDVDYDEETGLLHIDWDVEE